MSEVGKDKKEVEFSATIETISFLYSGKSNRGQDFEVQSLQMLLKNDAKGKQFNTETANEVAKVVLEKFREKIEEALQRNIFALVDKDSFNIGSTYAVPLYHHYLLARIGFITFGKEYIEYDVDLHDHP